MILPDDKAEQYFLVPFDKKESKILIGGRGVAEKLFNHVEEDDVLGYLGIAPLSVYFIVKYNAVECVQRVQVADHAYMSSVKGDFK